MNDVTEAVDAARAAANAVQQLCLVMLIRPSMTPAEVDLVMADLVEATVALTQTTKQLDDILE